MLKKRETQDQKIKRLTKELAAELPNIGPVTVALPNTSKEKMQAIVELSKAIHNASKALISTATEIEISNCHIVGTEIGIKIDLEDD